MGSIPHTSAITPTQNHIYYRMKYLVLFVFVISAIIGSDAGVSQREKRTLGLVKLAAAKAAAHPVATAALLGKYAIYKHLKGKKKPAPAPVAPPSDYWYEPIVGGDSEPWTDVDPAEGLTVYENSNSSPLIGVQGGFEAGPLSINAGISAGR